MVSGGCLILGGWDNIYIYTHTRIWLCPISFGGLWGFLIFWDLHLDNAVPRGLKLGERVALALSNTQRVEWAGIRNLWFPELQISWPRPKHICWICWKESKSNGFNPDISRPILLFQAMLQSIREAAWGIVTQWNSNLPNTPAHSASENLSTLCSKKGALSQRSDTVCWQIWQSEDIPIVRKPSMIQDPLVQDASKSTVLHVSDQIIVNSARPVKNSNPKPGMAQFLSLANLHL